jgi:hypothetical protein
MSLKTDIDYEMSIVREAHERPPFAVLWGVDTSEVPHNKFLHHIFKDHELGIVLLKAMLVEVQQPSMAADDVAEIVDAVFQENIGNKQRLDETLILKLKNGEAAILIIEMKVEAPEGEDQLAEYRATYDAPEWSKGRMVEGLLLRFTEEAATTQPTLRLSGYCRALESIIGREGKRVSSGAIHDYHRTCRMLLARERVLLTDPARLMAKVSDDHCLTRWQEDNWRWACERLLRGVDAAMMKDHGGGADKPGAGVLGAGVTKDPYGAHLDFCKGGGEKGERSHNPGTEPGFVAHKDGKPMARGFFKLRAMHDGIRLEVQTLVEPYPDGSPAERAARHGLGTRLAKMIQEWNEWEKPSRTPRANLRSGCSAIRKLDGWMPPDQLAETAWTWAQDVLARVAKDE